MTQKRKPSPQATDKVMPPASLSELCAEAADHVARARLSLFDDGADGEAALLHLDEAIFCLKRLLALGRRKTPAGPNFYICYPSFCHGPDGPGNPVPPDSKL
jgi:hypothetical protein